MRFTKDSTLEVQERAPSPNRAQRLHSLDVLRGIAALAVVLWHWQHFYHAPGGGLEGFVRTDQPLYRVFEPLYEQGWRAVELFFCLSGFIFTWLYADDIRERHVSARQFSVLRFSRLYPLHLATLLYVAVGQLYVLREWGAPFVYRWNDVRHFALQLAFAGGWGLERGSSYNGPAWSVSVEIVLYAVFFAASYGGVRRWWQYAAIGAFGYLIKVAAEPYNLGVSSVGYGLFCFNVGAIALLIFRALVARELSRGVLLWLAGSTLTVWCIVPLVSQWVTDHGTDFLLNVVSTIRPTTSRAGMLAHFGTVFPGVLYELLVFPLTIVTLAALESTKVITVTRLRTLGELSYSSYMLHFPLQLTVVIVTRLAHVPTSVFGSALTLLAFYTLLLPLALASYRKLELPAQRSLRRRLLAGQARIPAPRDDVIPEDAAPRASA